MKKIFYTKDKSFSEAKIKLIKIHCGCCLNFTTSHLTHLIFWCVRYNGDIHKINLTRF